jgi:hypothetical protein
VLPYPNGRISLYRTAFCLRVRAAVRKQPECYTCSWCETGSTVMMAGTEKDPLPAPPNGECLKHRKQDADLLHRAA